MRDDKAQMMLLTAFILLIGFVALAGMVSRVSQLSDETGQESRRGTVLEAAGLLDGVDQAFDRLMVLSPPGDVTQTTTYVNNLNAAMDHLDQLQSARGFRFVATAATCDVATAPDAVVSVDITITRADFRMTATISRALDNDTLGVAIVQCPI